MQQATVNLFADMGVQPLTIQAGLVDRRRRRPTRSARRPRSPRRPADSVVAANAVVTITGTAADAGGGRVGGVEVSVDGGATLASRRRPRRPGPTRGRPAAAATVTLMSRAADDSGNIELPATGAHGHRRRRRRQLPLHHLVERARFPVELTEPDRQSPSSSARKFRADTDGYITGIQLLPRSRRTSVPTSGTCGPPAARSRDRDIQQRNRVRAGSRRR